MIAADQIVDSSITNNNSNNEREVDGDFKRVNEVLESSKACVFQPNLFSRKKLSRSPKRAPKRSASSKKLLWHIPWTASRPSQTVVGRLFSIFSFFFSPSTVYWTVEFGSKRWNLA